MATEKFVNNGQTTVASPYTAGATSLVVTDASKLPSLTGDDQFHIVVFDPASPSNAEILLVTSVTGNTLTVVPAQEEIGGVQTSFNHAAGETVANELSVESLTNLIEQLDTVGTGDVTSSANITDNRIVRGDGGAKGVQESRLTVSDEGGFTQSYLTTFADAASTIFSHTLSISGTPLAGFGSRHSWFLQTTTSNRPAVRMDVIWSDPTDATRVAEWRFYAFDTAQRTVLKLSANGSAATIGFLGADAVVRQTGDIGTSLVNLGLMSGTPTFAYANLTGVPSTFAPSAHTHTASEITDFTTSVQTVGDARYSLLAHNHDATYAPLVHTHDDRYYTETEVDTLLSGKANTSHTHDDRYYTETEVDTLLSGKSDTGHTHTASNITDFTTAVQTVGDARYSLLGHNHDATYAAIAHTHDDRYYTESEVDTFLAGKSDTGHNHDSDYAPISHTHTVSEITDFPTIPDVDYASPSGMRLTLTSGTPVTTSDVTGAGTLYLAVDIADYILIPNTGATDFEQHNTGELSLSLTLTSGKNYDVFVWNNGGTPTLALSSAWTNDTTRADALGTLKGIQVNNAAIGSMGAKRGIWVGTIRASGSNTTEDSITKRFVWNAYNQRQRHLFKGDSTDNWVYTTQTWRQANNSTANQVEILVGRITFIEAFVQVSAVNASGCNVFPGVGVDSTTANSAQTMGGITGSLAAPQRANYMGNISAGYHYLAWLEASQAFGTTLWYGDNGFPGWHQGGIHAKIMG
jgi:hypothetical protein